MYTLSFPLFKSLVTKTLRKRRDLLHSHFSPVEGEFMYATSMISTDTEDIAVFLDESIKGRTSNRWFSFWFSPFISFHLLILVVRPKNLGKANLKAVNTIGNYSK